MTSFRSFVRALGVTLYPAQARVAAVAFDGEQPDPSSPLDRQLFGPIDAVPDHARDVVAAVVGGRGGKSYILGALRLLHLGVTHPLDTLAPGERGFGLVVAERMALARQTLRFIRGAVRQVPELERRIVGDGTDALVLDRPDGRRIAFEVIAASRGGSAVRARSYFGAFLDEASFFYSDDGYVATDGEIFRAVSPRVLPGGQLVIASTPWLESGILYDLFRANHGDPSCAIDGTVTPGSPTSALAVHAPTKLFNLDPKIHRAIDREYQRDPVNAEREFGARYVQASTGAWFDGAAINRAVVDRAETLAPSPGCEVGVGIDLGFRADASAIVVVRHEGGVYRVAELCELRPDRGTPLVPSAVVECFSAIAKRHGAREWTTDLVYIESIRELAEARGLHTVEAPSGQRGKVDTYTIARNLLAEGKVEIATAHKALVHQLRAVVGKPTQGGSFSITSPRRAGSHGDLVSAFVLALTSAHEAAEVGGDLSVFRVPGRYSGRVRPRPSLPAGAIDATGSRFTFFTDSDGVRRVKL